MVLNVSHSPQYHFFSLKTCFCLPSSGAEGTQYQSWESRLRFITFKLEQGFSVSTLLTFILDNYLLWGLCYVCRLFSSILGLYPRCVIYTATWRTWVWASSRSQWWTGKPSVLQSMGLQRVGHDWETELNWPLSTKYQQHFPQFLQPKMSPNVTRCPREEQKSHLIEDHCLGGQK